VTGRVKLDIGADEIYPVYSASETEDGEYSLSAAEYADYLAVCDKYQEWQYKLAGLKPDDYVPPPPPTEEELLKRKEARKRAAERIQYMNSTAFSIALQTPIEEGA